MDDNNVTFGIFHIVLIAGLLVLLSISGVFLYGQGHTTRHTVHRSTPAAVLGSG